MFLTYVGKNQHEMKGSKLFPDHDYYFYLRESLQVLYDIYTYSLVKHKISVYILESYIRL